jgi:diketogulonate reductase-like aldo/keto reductase
MLMHPSRRTFLKTMTAMGAAGLIPAAAYAQAPASILKRPIPGTGEMLPVIGLGSSAAVMQMPQDGPGVVSQLIETLVSHGASMIDTAPREAALDEAFGRVLSDPRWKDRLFVNTKIGRNRALNLRSIDRQGVLDQMRQTERHFGKRPADLILIDSMNDNDLHWPTLREAKNSGGARYIGITTSNTPDHASMEAFMKSSRPDFIQVNYSLLEPDADLRILPLARDQGTAVIINTPFAGGEYFKRVSGKELPAWAAEFDCGSWAQFNLKYIISEPAVNCVLTETVKTVHMEDNLRAATGRLPDAATRARMKAHFDSIAG